MSRPKVSTSERRMLQVDDGGRWNLSLPVDRAERRFVDGAYATRYNVHRSIPPECRYTAGRHQKNALDVVA